MNTLSCSENTNPNSFINGKHFFLVLLVALSVISCLSARAQWCSAYCVQTTCTDYDDFGNCLSSYCSEYAYGETISVQGTVTTASGAPLANALVNVQDTGPNTFGTNGGQNWVLTNSSGKYNTSLYIADDYNGDFEFSSCAVGLPQNAQNCQQVTVADNCQSSQTLNFKLSPAPATIALAYGQDCPSGSTCTYYGAAGSTTVSMACASGTMNVSNATFGGDGGELNCLSYVSPICQNESSCSLSYSVSHCGGDPDPGFSKAGVTTVTCSGPAAAAPIILAPGGSCPLGSTCVFGPAIGETNASFACGAGGELSLISGVFTSGFLGLNCSSYFSQECAQDASCTASFSTTSCGDPDGGSKKFLLGSVSCVPLEPLADLIVTSVTPATTSAVLNTPMNFSVVVKNQGGSTASNFVVTLYNNPSGTPFSSSFNNNASPTRSVTVGSLAAGQSTTLNITTTYTSTGSRGTYVLVDSTQVVKESNESNNSFGPIAINVVSTPVSLPDLLITSATPSTSSPAVNATVTYTVTVKNQGGSTASNFVVTVFNNPGGTPFTSSFNNNSSPTSSVTVGSLAAGQSTTLKINTAYSSAGSRGTYVLVDSTQVVKESNENNNSFGPISIKSH